MTQNTKQKLIKHFNLLKIMGYEYHEPVDLHLTKNDESIVLPDTIDTLKELVDNCSLCELNKYTKKKFFSKGNLTSKVMIIGDFPSSDNYDPFAGQSGKMLVAMCQNVLKLDPNDVYYTTILKCNVPLSQAVHNDNINCCKDYFIKQIEIIRRKTMTKQDFIDELNKDLANEFSAIIQYTIYAAKVMGPFRPELAKFFLEEVSDEQEHAKFLADKIITLGGTPTTIAANVAEASTNREMLEEVMKAEDKAIQAYTKRAEQASELGYKALSMDLEDMIRDETNHKEEVSKILQGWTLD